MWISSSRTGFHQRKSGGDIPSNVFSSLKSNLTSKNSDLTSNQQTSVTLLRKLTGFLGRRLAKLLGSHEDIGHGEHGGNGQNLVAAFEFGPRSDRNYRRP